MLPLRVGASLAVAIVLALLGLTWFEVARFGDDGLSWVHGRPGESGLVVQVVPHGPADRAGIRPGDRVLTVNGVSSDDVPGLRADMVRNPLRPGATKVLRVARDGAAPRDVPVVLEPLLSVRTTETTFHLLSHAWTVLLMSAVGLAVLLVRPRDAAARLLFAAALGADLGIVSLDLAELRPQEPWPHVGLAAMLLFAGATLHLFLVFPTPTRLSEWLRRAAPGSLRPLGGWAAALYLPPAAYLALYDPATGGTVRGVGRVFGVIILLELVGALAALVSRWLKPGTLVARAQLTWLALAVGIAVPVTLVNQVPPMVSGGSVASLLPLWVVVAAWSLFPLALGLAVLRYGLFDVDRVARQGVTYALLSGLIALAYGLVSFAASQIVEAVAGSDSVWSGRAPALAAVVLAVAAAPLRARVQRALDATVYRSRAARRRLFEQAAELLARGVSADSVAHFLTRDAPAQLGVGSAWLIAPDVPLSRLSHGDGAERLPADALWNRVHSLWAQGRPEPALLTAEDLGLSRVATVRPADSVLEDWHAAGARVLVPLVAPASDDAPAQSQPEPRATGAATGRLLGVWVLGRPRHGGLPDREDLATLGRVARQTAVLLNHARLEAEQVRQALTAQEVERARQIQARLLPTPADAARAGWPGLLEIAARLVPARETSGDFYDLFALGPQPRNGHLPSLQVAVGDVQGKGIGAALVMGLAQATLRTAAHECAKGHPTSTNEAPLAPAPSPSPAATLSLAGSLLNRGVGSRDFVACALAVLDPPEPGRRTVRLRLANGAQVPPLLYRNGTTAELVPGGEALPLGVVPDPHYRELSTDLDSGDVLVLASDGLIEAPAADGGEYFGFARFAGAVTSASSDGATASAILDRVWQAATAWCGEESHHDDMTLLVLRVP